MKISKEKRYIDGIAMIVDVNGFESMVSKGWDDNVGLFVRDILIGGVGIVERNFGEVVAFMGDAFLAILPEPTSAGNACLQIADDLRRMNEYTSPPPNRILQRYGVLPLAGAA